MNPMVEAIKRRRMPKEDSGSKLQELMGQLSDEQKKELFGMLQKEMSSEGQEEQPATANPIKSELEDGAGQLKTTPGEQKAIDEETGMNLAAAKSLYDPNMNPDSKPKDFIERAKQNVFKMMKGKGY